MERIFATGLLLISFTFPAYANEALLKHTTAVAQAMSAMYMEALTHGNTKYEKDLVFHTQIADEHMQSLAASELPGAQAFNQRWLAMKDKLNVEYTQDYEWDVHADIRRDFRRYQTELYDLEADPGEQKNVIKEFPEVADDMKKLLEQVRKSSGLRFD